MAIDWEGVAKQFGYVGEKEMWTRLYGEYSIAQMCQRLGISRNTVRERMAKHGIVARKRGGPNRRLAVLTDEVVEKALTEGVAAVAAEKGIEYNTLYKRVKAVREKRGLTTPQAEGSEPQSPPDSPPSGEGPVKS